MKETRKQNIARALTDEFSLKFIINATSEQLSN